MKEETEGANRSASTNTFKLIICHEPMTQCLKEEPESVTVTDATVTVALLAQLSGDSFMDPLNLWTIGTT